MLIQSNGSGNWKSKLTHCENGHEFTEETTYISPKSKKRSCRVCQSNRKRELRSVDLMAARAKERQHMAEWRAANKERDRKNWTDRRKRMKEWLDSQKTACIKCGESDIVCLDFHHKDPTQKDANLSVAVAHWSMKKLQIEMAKCIMICSNCHRKLHAQERAQQEVVI